MSNRLPDMRLKVLNKVTGEKGVVGAAWCNDDGSISLVLNSHVVLVQSRDEVLTLFPIDSKRKENTP